MRLSWRRRRICLMARSASLRGLLDSLNSRSKQLAGPTNSRDIKKRMWESGAAPRYMQAGVEKQETKRSRLLVGPEGAQGVMLRWRQVKIKGVQGGDRQQRLAVKVARGQLWRQRRRRRFQLNATPKTSTALCVSQMFPWPTAKKKRRSSSRAPYLFWERAVCLSKPVECR